MRSSSMLGRGSATMPFFRSSPSPRPCSINIINSLAHQIGLGWNWTLVLRWRPFWDENMFVVFVASENVNTIQVKPFASRVIVPAPVLYFLTHQSVDELLEESTSWLYNTTGNVGFQSSLWQTDFFPWRKNQLGQLDPDCHKKQP